QQKDALNGLHANTQIPKVIGFARIASIAGDSSWTNAANFFWNTVTQHRTISIGGNSVREHFNPATDFSSMIETKEGPETCNSYNMLKLSKQLFLAHPSATYMDYYERTLYNHILSSQHPDGGFVYFTPVRPRHYRVYSQPQMGMWCCVGTGLENHGKYGELI
ncbi:glycosyl hydrolase, partial [Neptunomonas marina]